MSKVNGKFKFWYNDGKQKQNLTATCEIEYCRGSYWDPDDWEGDVLSVDTSDYDEKAMEAAQEYLNDNIEDIYNSLCQDSIDKDFDRYCDPNL